MSLLGPRSMNLQTCGSKVFSIWGRRFQAFGADCRTFYYFFIWVNESIGYYYSYYYSWTLFFIYTQIEQFPFNVSKFNHICRPKPNTIYVPQSYIWGFQVGICITMVHNVGFWALGSCCSSEGVRFHKNHTLLISLGLIHVNAISIGPV